MKSNEKSKVAEEMIFIEMVVDGIRFKVDMSDPIEIAIPLDFEGTQPNVHGIGKATSKILEESDFVGDVGRGGSCNWRQYALTPHSHGTHTESIGHITKDSFPIHAIFNKLLIPLTLISIRAVSSSSTTDTYFPDKKENDLLITRNSLEEKLGKIPDSLCQGIAIRTLPNDPSKMVRDYQKQPPPFFSREAMEYLIERKVEHLLVDFPSLDKMHDDGHMLNHHLFWNMPLGTVTPDIKAKVNKTITEMIFVPSTVTDGHFAMNLQIPCFIADAAPSRPLLFPLIKIT